MATNNVVFREYSKNPEAVQKRKYRVVQREKRRRSYFVHDYIRTKYPSLFNEANAFYQQLIEKYPAKPDITKTYYFKKWQKGIDQSRTCLMVPHLPILTSAINLQQSPTRSHQQTDDEPNEFNEQEPDEPGEQEPNEPDGPSDEFEQMTLEEIDRAVDQIVSQLQKPLDDEPNEPEVQTHVQEYC